MKLWCVFVAALLFTFLSIGYSDIGFGADVEIEEEIVDETGDGAGDAVQILTPLYDIPAPNSKESLDVVDRQHNEEYLQLQIDEFSGASTVQTLSEPGSIAAADQSVADSNIEQVGTLKESAESAADDTEVLSQNSSFVLEESSDVVIETATTSPNTETRSTHAVITPPATISTIDTLAAEAIPAAVKTSDKEEDARPSSFGSMNVEALLIGIDGLDGDLGLGGSTEALLDQLDEASQQIVALTAENAALRVAISTSADSERALSDQLSELRDRLAQVNAALANAQGECQSRANASSAQQDEVRALAEKLAAAERNVSTLEIRVRLEKNEKVIARLSTENCLLELETARHLHQEEVEELTVEIARLRKQGGITTAAGGAAQTAGSPSGSPPQAVSRSQLAERQRGQTCDPAQCVDTLLSKYVFFWAPEHRPDDSQSSGARPRSSTAPPTATTSSVSSVTPEAPPKAPTPARSGLSDADFDRIGDEESSALVALRLLQHGASAAWAGYSVHVYPLLYHMLKFEFQLAAAVVKGADDGVAWLWSSVLSPMYLYTVLPAAQNMYHTQVLPFVNSAVYPWYKANLEQTVDSYAARATAHWMEHYDEWFGYHVADPAEFLVGRLYVAQYFAVKFFTSEDLGEHLEAIGAYVAGFVPSVIHQLSSISALQSYFGDHCVTAVSALVYSSVALFVFLARRVLLGMVAIAVVLLLSPLLVAVYVFAKLVGMFRPRKKAKRAVSGRPARTARDAQHSGQHNRESGSSHQGHSGVHTTQPPQLATRQLPLDIPVTGRELRSSVGVSVSGATSISGRPPQQPQTRSAGAPPLGSSSSSSSKYSSGPPPAPRQSYPRGGDLDQGSSGSRSGDSLSKMAGPPVGAWAGAEPEV